MADDTADEHPPRSDRRNPVTFDSLPLFATDAELAVALFGKRAAKRRSMLDMLAHRPGFPPIDAAMGGRYKYAVKAFFDHRYKLTDTFPAKPQGVEGTIVWDRKKLRKRPGVAD